LTVASTGGEEVARAQLYAILSTAGVDLSQVREPTLSERSLVGRRENELYLVSPRLSTIDRA